MREQETGAYCPAVIERENGTVEIMRYLTVALAKGRLAGTRLWSCSAYRHSCREMKDKGAPAS